MLIEPEEQLTRVKESLLAGLGTNGQIICNIIPELSLIIGDQPSIVELAPTESKNRFIMTFQNFIRALSLPEHPLVLFLDDLQWVDTASLQIIENLFKDSELHYFFLIGAYRDNEVSVDHPLALMMQQIEKSGYLPKRLSLAPLTQIDIQHLLADNLNHSQKIVEPLAKSLLKKTDGNPFYINEFIKALYQEKILFFSYEKRAWMWDIKEISKKGITYNVIDLLISRIHQLSDVTQWILQLAACIGFTFDLKTLSLISEEPLQAVKKQLWETVLTAFIQPLDEKYQDAALSEIIGSENFPSLETIQYQFIHDRIQQAAYQLIPADLKKVTHLKIGRLLLQDKEFPDTAADLFSIVDHFSLSIDLITDEHEKEKISPLLLCC